MDEQGLNEEAGFSLVEVLLALVILSVASVAFLTGLAASTQESGLHRHDATLETVLRNEAEALQAAATSCAGNLAPAYALPTDVSGRSYSVDFAPKACPVQGAPASVTVSGTSPDGQVADSYTVIVRAP